MFDYFIGTVKELKINTVVLEVGGIGYELNVSNFCLNELKLEGNVKLYTYLNIYEGGISLYGFYSKEEKAMFLRLISISGIAAKGAIGILSGLALNDLCVAIASGDAKAISKIKGVGKKTAERIVLELRDKLGEEFAVDQKSNDAVLQSDIGDEALLALMALGFSKQESINAIKKVDINGKTVEEVVKAALKRG